ncbi:D-alanyl-lipoteichoic acid biosynthesis protein DltD [Lacticaseibacillus nasuensis]|uniref:D-alanyl-lipoteichoic acid biosynthesis protein DltD n=1 Tax=Lacticaseibacillus nasuensis TaxID=944671 RepID=UPI001585AFC9|nr:D-alanyl-lipoteichoic acid biosynthesis protein DltD [Lacticaseibacillus nasuensis]
MPTQATPESLTALAEKIGRAHTTNNRLGIDNHFFARRLGGGKLRALRGSQKHFDYLSSPEYGDFQLLLQQFAENHIDVQFVIPPINQRWARYTGLSLPMVRRAANKVQAQLRTQGFNRVLNLSNDGNRPFFMQDTIHLGWAAGFVLIPPCASLSMHQMCTTTTCVVGTTRRHGNAKLGGGRHASISAYA